LEKLINKYQNKLYSNNIVEKDAPLFGALDANIYWNKKHEKISLLNQLFKALSINSILYSEPAQPYKTIIDYLSDLNQKTIFPQDTETRTFLHDLQICHDFNIDSIIKILKHRKSVIIKDYGIITKGNVSPEQAYVVYSSVCFACFIKFFSDYLSLYKQNKIDKKYDKFFQKVISYIDIKGNTKKLPVLKKAPFESEADVYMAICEAGKYVVDFKLVDSYFGNISHKSNDILYISQTGSSLDELKGCIDPCPLDGSSCTAITASSEFSAHKQIVLNENINSILHGHPHFSVIMSMDCDHKENCENKNYCHIKCKKNRFIDDIPIVSGEVGTGKYGLCNTLPDAVFGKRGAIVYGHGLFTTAKKDFNEAFHNLYLIENMCKNKYFERLEK